MEKFNDHPSVISKVLNVPMLQNIEPKLGSNASWLLPVFYTHPMRDSQEHQGLNYVCVCVIPKRLVALDRRLANLDCSCVCHINEVIQQQQHLDLL